MRILLTHHLPLEGSDTGRATRDLAAGLTAAGHEVLCLVVEGRYGPASVAEEFAIERVRCAPGDPEADVAFDVPGLESLPFTRQTFEDLSDFQLVEYRNALRRRMDRCVEKHNPHLIHCQHAWLFAHLALESGAPYVVTAQGPDLHLVATSARYRRLVEQALENAATILVHSQAVARQVTELFPELHARVLLVSPSVIPRHVACYETALNQRYGPTNWS